MIKIDKDTLKKIYNNCDNRDQAAKHLGISTWELRKKLKEYNIPSKKKGKRKYNLNENFFKDETAEVFYVAGFLAADGNIKCCKDKRGKPCYDIQLALKEEDMPHLQKIQKLLQSNYKLFRRVHENSKKNIKWNDYVSYFLKISSKIIVIDLLKFNIGPRKSLTYIFPEWLKSHPLVSHFLRGYFDGDGSIYFDKSTNQNRLKICGTINFLQNFHNILYEKCNLKIQNKNIITEKGIWSIGYSGNNISLNILNYLYKESNITMYLDRKYERFIKLQHTVNNVKKIKFPPIDELIIICQKYKILKEIAKYISCHEDTIRNHLKKYNLTIKQILKNEISDNII